MAQQSLEIMGTVKDGVKGLGDVKVTLMKDNRVVRHVSTNASGKFKFTFDANADYLIITSKDGYVTKSISFNTRVPGESGPVWDFDFIVELFKDMPGLDKAVFKNPVAKVYFNATVNDFDYDLDYAMDFKKREQEVMRQVEEMRVNKEKEEAAKVQADLQAKKEAEKANADKAKQEAAALKEKRTKFEGLIQQADASIKKQQYDDATAKLKEAEKLFPEDFRPQQKLDEVGALKEAAASKLNEQKAKDDKFNALKAEADKLYVAGDLKEAKAAYQEVQQVKGDVKEINDLIKQLDGMIAQKAKEAEEFKKKQGEIEQLIKTGDDQLRSGKLADAKATFQKAEILDPADQRIKNRLADALAKLEEESRKNSEAQAQLKEYERLVAEASKAEKAADFEKAKQLFTSAIAIKADGPAATEGLTRTTQAMAAQAKMEEDKRKSEQQVATLMADAQKLMAAAQFDEAVRKLEQADIASPGNKDLTKLLAQARSGAEERRKQDEADRVINEQFQSAMSQGRIAVERKSYDTAIEAFGAAVKLKPDDKAAQDALKQVTDQRKAVADASAEQKKKEQQYIQKLKEGEGALTANDFTKAEGIYESAVQLMPERTEASVQLVKIRAEIERRKRSEEESARLKAETEVLFNEAEKLFQQENYEGAVLTYKRVLGIDKAHAGSIARIAEIETLLSKRETDKKKLAEAQLAYGQFIAAGNEALLAKKYERAREAYASAAQAMPEATEPAVKIKEIDDALAQIKAAEDEQLSRDQQYVDMILKAEGEFTADKMTEAIATYRSAATIKPNEKLPIKRIAEIEDILADRRKEDERRKATEMAELELKSRQEKEAAEKQRLDEERARIAEARKQAEGDAVRLAEEERQKQIAEAKAKELERQRIEQEKRILEQQEADARRRQFEEAGKARLAQEEQKAREAREAQAAKDAEDAQIRQQEEAKRDARLRAEQEAALAKQAQEREKLQSDLAETAEAEAARMQAEAEAILKKKMDAEEARMKAEVEAKLKKEFEEQYAREVRAAQLAKQVEDAKAAQVIRDAELADRERIKQELNAEAERVAKLKAEEDELKRNEAEEKAKLIADQLAMEAKVKAEQERLDKEEAELLLRTEQARIEAEKLARRAAELEARKLAEAEAIRVAMKADEKAKFAAEQERIAREEAQRAADDRKIQDARLKEEEARMKAEELVLKKKFAAEQYAAQAKEREARELQMKEEQERIRKEEIALKEKNFKDKQEFEKKAVDMAKQNAKDSKGSYEDEVRRKLEAEYNAKRATLGIEEVKKAEDPLKGRSTAFQQSLAAKYPKGITEERDVKPNQEITIVIVNRGDGVPNEYRKVRWNWGGVYFFKNGESTSKLIYDAETQW